MKRRILIKNTLAGGAALAMAPWPLAASTAKTILRERSSHDFKHQFNAALPKQPKLLGFKNIAHDFARSELTIEGQLPKTLEGVFLRNGPAKHERGPCRLKHLFEGDGMVQRFTLRGGRIFHEGRFINTPKFAAEERAEQFLYSGPDTQIPNSLDVYNRDVINTANTSILPVGKELWALWEGGSPARLNPESLDFEQFIDLGEGSKHGKRLQGLPFSAHPKVDTNGDIWNFGLVDDGRLVIYQLAKSGKLKNLKLLHTEYQGGILHDFLITERHLLFILPSIKRRPSIKGLFASIQYDDALPMQVLVIDKHSLSLKRTFELAAGFAFHFGNAWEERDGTIRFDASLYPNANILGELSDVMRGHIKPQLSQSQSQSQTALFTLKPSGSIERVLFHNNSEFPRVSAAFTGRKNRYLYFTQALHNSFWGTSVARMDWQTQTQSHYFYGDDFMVEEHIPVSLNNEKEAQFVMGTALHIPSKRTCLNLFNANRLSDGPIMRAWLPYHLPLGFHGAFIASAT